MTQVFFILTLFFVHPIFSNCTYEILLPKIKTVRNSSNLQNMTRDSLLFMLTAFVEPSSKTVTNADFIVFDCRGVTQEAKKTFGEMDRNKSYLGAYAIIKDFLKTGAYHRAMSIHHSIPLEEVQFTNWPKKVVGFSQVKGMRRILYRSPEGLPKMSVAQTVAWDGSIRETEIILKREDQSGNYDFYAFDSEGEPAFRSTFYNSHKTETTGPVPHTCMSCHYDGNERLFQPKPNSFHP